MWASISVYLLELERFDVILKLMFAEFYEIVVAENKKFRIV